MRRLAWALPLTLFALLPAAGGEEPFIPPNFGPGGGPIAPPAIPSAAQPPNAALQYAAPAADGPVVELIDEGVDPLLGQLINDGGGEPGTVTREDRDVYAGVEAVRVTPMQKYRSRIPGWGYRIVEKPTAAPGPKAPGEYRFLRFAWKKNGGAGIMVQLHDATRTWAVRFFAGRNVHGWQPAISVGEKIPGEWQLVTRDLFKEGGEVTLTGIALTVFDGTDGLFDHVLLGRTVEDLDRATDAALGRLKPAKPLDGKERDRLWTDLLGADAKKAGPALRAFLAAAPDQVKFIRERLGEAPDNDQAARVAMLVRDLDSDAFDTREAATDELVKLGPAVIDVIREVGRTAPNDEVRFRARVILRKLGGGPGGTGVSKSAKLSRVVRVLEKASTPDARTLLAEIADGKLAPEVAGDAKAALARLPKN